MNAEPLALSDLAGAARRQNPTGPSEKHIKKIENHIKTPLTEQFIDCIFITWDYQQAAFMIITD